MRCWIILLMILSLSSLAHAQELVIDEATKQVCNRVIVRIYQDLLAIKDDHTELSQFDENVMYENQHGIYAIVYKYKQSDKQERRKPFEIGVTVVGLEDTMFNDKGRYAFNLGFPILGLKFAGYEIRGTSKYRSPFGDLISKYGDELAQHQQKYMPLQLTLTTEKDVYRLYEPVKFRVQVKNVGHRHIRVKGLNEKTLYCLFNNKQWGTIQSKQGQSNEFILKKGDSASMDFVGEEFGKPKEFELYCEYNMTIKGVKPFGKLKVNVIDE